MSGIPINSGTGPIVTVDLVGTDNQQVMKVSLAASGATGSFLNAVALSVTNTSTAVVSVGNTPSVNVANAPVVSISAGTITTVLGTVAVSGGGGGAQYPQGTTINATGTGTLIMGLALNTAQPILVHTTGGLIIASMPAVGGGQQYPAGDTSMGATATGTVVLGIQSGGTTGRAIAVTTTGAQIMSFVTTQAVTAANVTIASITTGTLNVINVLSASGVTIASVTTGTMNVINVLSASGVTIASVTTGTMNVINVLSASGVTIASVTTGTMHVINTVTITGSASMSGTGNVTIAGTVLAAPMLRSAVVKGYTVNTNSSNTILITSSAGVTLYVTSLLFSVDSPMSIKVFSAATTVAELYLATKGGAVVPIHPGTPLFMNSNAQSLTFTPSSSGSCAGFAIGYMT